MAVESTPTSGDFPVNASVTSVSAANADTQLVAGRTDGARRHLLVFNDSTANLYLKMGTGASASSFTVKLVAAAYYELPDPVYQGQINGFWDAANGAARVSETTGLKIGMV